MFLLARKNDKDIVTKSIYLPRDGGCHTVPGVSSNVLYKEYVKLSKKGYTIAGMALVGGLTVKHMGYERVYVWPREYASDLLILTGYGGTLTNDLPLLIIYEYKQYYWYSKYAHSKTYYTPFLI